MSDMETADPNGRTEAQTELIPSDPSQALHAPSISPGAQLAAKREELNWSIEQVASHLNLAPRQIAALEADNHAALPGIAIVRGFVRAYAKLLRIDPVPLLQTISNEATTADQALPLRRVVSSKPFTDNRSLTMEGQRKGMRYAVYAGLGLILIGSALLAFRMGWVPEQIKRQLEQNFGVISVAPVASTAETDNSQPDVGGSGEAAITSGFESGEAVGTSSQLLAAPAAGADTATPENSRSATASTEVQGKALPPDERAAQQQAVTSLGQRSSNDASDALVLKLREDSWLDIKRQDGTTVMARLAKAGSTETIKVGGPLSITIGNAAGVEATLRGESVKLKDRANNNVARLTIQ